MTAQKSANTIGLPSGGPSDRGRFAAGGLTACRETLLATTALTLGLALSMSAPDSALADCTVTSSPNSVNCGINTTTTDTTLTDGSGSFSDRAFTFTSGGVNAIIQSGVLIDGAGLAITGAAVTMTNNGTVDQTISAGSGGLRVQAGGGLLTYSGNGSVSANQGYTAALSLANTSGDIMVGSVGTPVTPAYTALGTALQAQTSGNVTVVLGGGILTADTGMELSTFNSGNITATLTGGTTLTTTSVGLRASTEQGNIVITSDANMGTSGARTNVGVDAISDSSSGAGAVTVTQTGGGIFATSAGIKANIGNYSNGSIVVDQQAGTINAGASGTGILATANNDIGAITITVAGGGIVASSRAVYAYATSSSNTNNISVSLGAAVVGTTSGVVALHNGTGTITVDGTALVQGGSDAGIEAVHAGTGPAAGTNGIVIGGSGNTTATSGGGIKVRMTNASNASNILVERSGTVTVSTGGAHAINATTAGTGNVTVRNAAGVSSFRGNGINASSAGGNVEVSANGAVHGGSVGIQATSTGAGTVTVRTGGTVTGLDGQGILASADTGTIQITVDHAVSGTGGDGVGTSGLGAISVQNTASITADGAFTGVMMDGGTNNVVDNRLGAVISGQIGVAAQNATGNTEIDNAGTITGTGGTAVAFTGGTGNILFMNGAGAALNGTALGNGADILRLGGSGTNTFDVAKIGTGFTSLNKTDASVWTLTGTATTTAATTVSGGTLLVNGNTASSATTVNAGGTLGGGGTVGNTTIHGGTLSPGNSIGTLSVQGTLTFMTASTYLVEVSPSSADRTNVSGTATLAGTVNASFLPGTYLERTYTILAAGTRTGTFDTLTTTNLPAGFSASMSYTGTEAVLNLTAELAQNPNTLPVGGLNPNQKGVAGALNSYFNKGGTLPPGFVTVFGQTGSSLGTTLSQISGESNAAAPETTFRATEYFIGLMLGARSGEGGSLGGAPLGFAAESTGAMPEEVALAYAKAMPGVVAAKAPPRAYEPRWSVWGSAYGGYATVDGNAGASSTSSRAGGFAVGADYRAWSDTVVGIALAGGGTSWGSANGGSGRSDTFQAGVYGSHRFGAAYVSAALAYAWHDTTTTRTVGIGPETLEGRFRPHVLSARAEAGYRFGFGAYGLTPYAAAQVQSFHAPAYTETATSGAGTFALSYGSQTETTPRTELGLWADHLQRVTADTDLLLRGRVAWAHDFHGGSRLNPSFVALPGASFTVDGVSTSPDLALLSAVAELKLRNGVSLSARFDGEFGSRSESYAGTGTLRYSW